MKKRVCIIYTGGTIGMTQTENGYSPKQGYLEKVMQSMPEFSSPYMPEYEFIEFDPLLDSSNVAVKQWIEIAYTIKNRYNEFDGFVVLHGTDTMAYTASALSFMLEGLAKPVILTGSQIPFCRIRNDAKDNLITAMLMAVENIPEVCLFFDHRLFRGNRSTKLSSDELSAFDSPNYPPLALAGIKIKLDEKSIRPPGSELTMRPFEHVQIAVLKIFPGIQFEVFENIMTENLKGIVLEAFGTGNIPSNSNALMRIVDKANQNGTVITVCTQCLRGSANIGTYETSAYLAGAGAVSGYDMTVEAAVTKLYYLFSLGYSNSEIKRLMETNLRGELTPIK